MRGEAPAWLVTAFSKQRSVSVRRCRRFFAEGVGAASVWENLKGQVFLGDDDFVERGLRRAKARDGVDIPRSQ